MPKLDHLGTGKILAMRFAHLKAFASDLEHKLAVVLLLGVANFPDQSDDVVPFDIMGRRMTEYRVERAAVPPVMDERFPAATLVSVWVVFMMLS